MEGKIARFISKQTCATVCCTDLKGNPWCFSCFYAFDKEKALLSFKSSPNSRHSSFLEEYPTVAGTIQPDQLNVLQVQGIQFRGVVLSESDPLCKSASGLFYKKNPLALAVPGKVWTIRIDHIKMTDNSMGFGSKTLWSREELTATTH